MSEMNGNDTLSELLKKVSAPPVSESIDTVDTAPVLTEGDEILVLGEDFDFEGFQVVRREFFAHLREPSCTFNNCKFSVNNACLQKFPNSDYAQVLVNREKKILALRPCAEGARDSFMWCSIQKGKRKPKAITCKLFYAKIVSLMGWNPDYRYKLLGKVIQANDEYLLAFDLTATEVYQKTFVEGEKPKTSRKPVFPAECQDQFGLPYNEHRQSLQINIFDDYAIFAVKENGEGDGGESKPTPTGDLVSTN
jgi:hypothetical protein